MSNESLEERNKKIRERMLDVKDIRFVPLPPDSPWLKPIRMIYNQGGKVNNWDLSIAADSISIVIFNVSRKKLVFVRQFRPAVYINCLLPKLDQPVDVVKYPATLGVTIELCAGTVDKNKSLVEIAQDELREECGYEAPVTAFEKVICHKSIGASVSKQTMYYVEVTDAMCTHSGGGLEEEGELIEVIEMSIDETRKYINSEEVQSPPSLLYGVWWFLVNKVERYS